MSDFLFLNFLDKEKNQNTKTKLVYIKQVDANEMQLILSFNNF